MSTEGASAPGPEATEPHIGESGVEAADAREYWATRPWNAFYDQAQHWRKAVAQRIATYSPLTVLELGCNVGRNLVEIRDAIPTAKLVGIDVSKDAVDYGAHKYGLDLRHGGEELLRDFEHNSFEVVFTVSVLDHIPNPDQVLTELARVARKALVLLEPYANEVGRVDSAGDAESGGNGALTEIPFTYSWDYILLTRKLGNRWRWRWMPYPLSGENLGPHYWLIEGRPSP